MKFLRTRCWSMQDGRKCTSFTVMTVILKSLGVVSASDKLAQCQDGQNYSAETDLAVHLSTWVSSADSWWTRDWLDERQHGSAELACGGAASLDGTRATVCGNELKLRAAREKRQLGATRT